MRNHVTCCPIAQREAWFKPSHRSLFKRKLFTNIPPQKLKRSSKKLYKHSCLFSASIAHWLLPMPTEISLSWSKESGGPSIIAEFTPCFTSLTIMLNGWQRSTHTSSCLLSNFTKLALIGPRLWTTLRIKAKNTATSTRLICESYSKSQRWSKPTKKSAKKARNPC